MTNSAEPASLRSLLLRHRIDGLLALSLLSALPLVAVFCSDLWIRSDLRFFPLLIIMPIGMAAWGARQPAAESSKYPESIDSGVNRPEHTRRLVSLGLWTAAAVVAACGAFLFSPWLAVLGLTLAWIARLLTRFEQKPWPRLLKWTLPLVILLILPLGEHSNPVPSFSSNVTYASSSLLDLLGIDHLPTQQTLQLSVGGYDVAAACHGLGHPYLMFSLVALMCLATPCSLTVGLLTTATAPLWSWGGTVLLVVGSVWLAEQRGFFIWPEQQSFYIWDGERLCLAQFMVLIGGLISALLIKWGLRTLLAPFEAHSAGVGAVHQFFNQIVLWPQPDPLSIRSSTERGQSSAADATSGDQPWLVRHSGFVLGIAACLFIACGTVSVFRLIDTGPNGWPSTNELMTHVRFSRLGHHSPLLQETLPEELLGMRLIGFEQFATPGTATGKPVTNRWTYINEEQTVIIQADAPYRGEIDIERQRLLDGSRLVERQSAVAIQAAAGRELVASEDTENAQDIEDTENADDTENAKDTAIAEAVENAENSKFLIESLTLDDPIKGRTYAAYTNWPIDGGSPAEMPNSGESMLSRLRSAVGYRPSSACVSLWLEGSVPKTKDESEQLQQILVTAAEIIRGETIREAK